MLPSLREPKCGLSEANSYHGSSAWQTHQVNCCLYNYIVRRNSSHYCFFASALVSVCICAYMTVCSPLHGPVTVFVNIGNLTMVSKFCFHYELDGSYILLTKMLLRDSSLARISVNQKPLPYVHADLALWF